MLLKLASLATQLGKSLDNSGRSFWSNSELPLVRDTLRALLADVPRTEEVCIDGYMPQFMVPTVVSAVRETHDVTIFDGRHNQGVPIVQLPTGEDCGVLFYEVTETVDYTFLTFQIRGRFMQPANLADIRVPEVNRGKGLILSGSGPYWLTGSLSTAYDNLPWFAMSDFNKGAVVAISRHADFPVGMRFRDDLLARETGGNIPCRGQVWVYDIGFGPHPCIIMSALVAPGSAATAMIVPITSRTDRDKPGRQMLRLSKGQGGLDRDCVANCSQVQTVKVESLSARIGTVSDDVVERLIVLIRQAMGDRAAFAAELAMAV